MIYPAQEQEISGPKFLPRPQKSHRSTRKKSGRGCRSGLAAAPRGIICSVGNSKIGLIVWHDDKKVKHPTLAAELFNDRVAGIKLKCFEDLAVSWLASGGRDTAPMFLRQESENKKIPSSSDEEEDKTAAFLHQFPSPHEHSH